MLYLFCELASSTTNLPYSSLSFWSGGSITIVFGIALFFFLPSSPVNSRYLNKRERYVAIERLRTDQSSVENKVFKREQVRRYSQNIFLCHLLTCLS